MVISLLATFIKILTKGELILFLIYLIPPCPPGIKVSPNNTKQNTWNIELNKDKK